MPKYTCPTCSKTVEAKDRQDLPYRPFCSRRCKLLDLSKWFNEEYRIESPSAAGQPDDPPQPPSTTPNH